MGKAERRCVIVSASPDRDTSFIRASINDNDFVVCADGGIDILKDTDIVPDLIVGDFDSAVFPDAFKSVETITLNVRKDDTDTLHCVDVALDRGFRDFLFLGATGGRTDHTLANLTVLLYLRKHGAKGVISDRYNDIYLLENGENILETVSGTTISVIPFASYAAELSYTGMSYPLDHGEVTADYPYTISNIAVSDRVVITLHSGTALAFVIK